jgi:cell division protein FtsQ
MIRSDQYRTIAFASITVVYILVMLSFIRKTEDREFCEGIDLEISTESQNYFIDKDDVVEIINDKIGPVLGQPFSQISVRKIEEALELHASIKKAEVFRGPNRIIQTRIEQRRPILRIIDKLGASYYLDENGFVMAISKKFTARVPVANGNISVNWTNLQNRYITRLDLSSSREMLIGDLYQLAKFIDCQSFWKKQIQQIYITEKGQMELVPRVGAQVIIMGEPIDYERKLSNLQALYDQVFAVSGWNQYREIDLRFSNQIVCRKKMK